MAERHRILPPFYFFGTLLLMAGLHMTVPIKILVPAPFNLVGAVLVAAGVVSAAWAAGLFHKASTPIIPFRPSTALVTGGMYRITRNPMYLGMVLALIGIAILLGTVSPFIPIPFFVWQIQRKFIRPEEEFLEEIFGQEYVAYKSRVRRWL